MTSDSAPPTAYTVYGDLSHRESIVLVGVMRAKGLAFEFVEVTPSLALALAARSGQEEGPYLRTAEGFLLGDLFAILEWIEATAPEPRMMPSTPVRNACARLLEDWLALWLPRSYARSEPALRAIGGHLLRANFMLGRSPSRVDWMLAAWLEAEVLVDGSRNESAEVEMPRLREFAEAVLSASFDRGPETDDAIPISLLGVLEEAAADYHAYLIVNHQAIKAQEPIVVLEQAEGAESFPVSYTCERRRAALGQALNERPPEVRRRVADVLEPIGAWDAIRLPAVLPPPDPTDPRSL